MSDILLVAPVPTHPSTTGASARIRHMARALETLGHEVRFLHLQQTLRDPGPAMREFWGDRLHVFRGHTPVGWMRRGRRKILRIAAKTLHFDLPADAYFDPDAARRLGTLVAERRFETVIVSYVFCSKLLETLPDSVRGLLDTHDIFSDRYRLYAEHGQAREFFSTTRDEEGRALDRADTVLAIQERDAEYFRSLTHRPVRVVGHLAPPRDASGAAEEPDAGASRPALLFVGGPMGINAHGIRWFIEHVLPLVRREVPDVELWLVGGICDRIADPGPGIRRFGFVAAPSDLYARATAVINPQRFGTGLSIKSVDALRHGRPLLATTSGARGLEDAAGSGLLVGDSAEELAGRTLEVLRDPARAAELGRRGADFAVAYFHRQLRALADLVGSETPVP